MCPRVSGDVRVRPLQGQAQGVRGGARAGPAQMDHVEVPELQGEERGVHGPAESHRFFEKSVERGLVYMAIDYAYFAGLIDGDGYIFVTPKPLGRYPRSRVQVVITSSNKWFLEKIKRSVGSGGIYQRKANDTRYSSKPSFNFVISKRGVVREILEKALPYLILKRKKALQALKILR